MRIPIDRFAPLWARLAVASAILFLAGLALGLAITVGEFLAGLGTALLVCLGAATMPYVLTLPWWLYDHWVRLLKVPWMFTRYIANKAHFERWLEMHQEWERDPELRPVLRDKLRRDIDFAAFKCRTPPYDTDEERDAYDCGVDDFAGELLQQLNLPLERLSNLPRRQTDGSSQASS